MDPAPSPDSSAPLSAPKSTGEIHTLSVVITIVATLSATGAAWMIMGFVLNKSLRSFRHQLVLGLAVSDLCMAINFLSSAAANLSGNNIGLGRMKTFCSFNGFMIQTFVDQTDYWVLCIAACTFIMVSERKSLSNWIQTYRVVIFAIPWILSLLWATLGLSLVGYGSIGAWCWFTSDKTRLLVNFLPRWIIIALMLALYIRLYFVIHRAHKNFVSIDDGDYEMGSRFKSSTTATVTATATGPSTPTTASDAPGVAPRRRAIRSKTAAPDLQRLAYQMMLYPLVYILVWSLPTSIRIYQAVTGKSAPFTIATIDESCIVIQGLLDAIVYGCNEKTFAGWKAAFTRKKCL
ncbi:hypothetical protein VHEMI09204 [[Torrubiella] hemipterigena]|uniref:G-protein coupled receptors family 2 profile 2 domain-containing protein n=1 Tax=[Torrubiella] hemipterigena TaxID=1531966 RepID=A0A0A1T940_9HYPO|nr:hypothetical protein VHEMI09204 [[Torrubiella] hemipterigena]